MKHIIPLILTLCLLGCQTPSGDIPSAAPTAENTLAPTLTPTLPPTLTEVPLEALPVEEIVRKYLAGEIDDVSGLSFELQKAFSIALNEKKNEQRGINPVIYSGTVHKIESDRNYIDPITGDYLPVDNGTTAEQQTIKMYIPRVVDDEGYTSVFYDGEWIKIEGSQNIQYGNFDNFNWPDTAIINPEDPLLDIDDSVAGLTIPEAHFKAKDGYEDAMTPIFFLDEVVGQINIFGIRVEGFITGFILNQKNPFLARKMIIAKGTNLYGNGIAINSGGGFVEGTDFFDKLKTNKLYYVMYLTDQRASFIRTNNGLDKGEVTANYSGLIPSNLTHLVIVGELEYENMLLIDGDQSFIVESGD